MTSKKNDRIEPRPLSKESQITASRSREPRCMTSSYCRTSSHNGRVARPAPRSSRGHRVGPPRRGGGCPAPPARPPAPNPSPPRGSAPPRGRRPSTTGGTGTAPRRAGPPWLGSPGARRPARPERGRRPATALERPHSRLDQPGPTKQLLDLRGQLRCSRLAEGAPSDHHQVVPALNPRGQCVPRLAKQPAGPVASHSAPHPPPRDPRRARKLVHGRNVQYHPLRGSGGALPEGASDVGGPAQPRR